MDTVAVVAIILLFLIHEKVWINEESFSFKIYWHEAKTPIRDNFHVRWTCTILPVSSKEPFEGSSLKIYKFNLTFWAFSFSKIFDWACIYINVRLIFSPSRSLKIYLIMPQLMSSRRILFFVFIVGGSNIQGGVWTWIPGDQWGNAERQEVLSARCDSSPIWRSRQDTRGVK